MNITHVIIYAIVPILVIMLVGFISGKRGVFSGDDAKKFNKVVLDYAPVSYTHLTLPTKA